jgi:gamma-glutamyl-gamma-aminobutyraldehyde dehydrogenase
MEFTLDRAAVLEAVAELEYRTQAFIDGAFRPAVSGATLPTVNPANGRTIADIASCDAADVDLAVAAARRSFETGVWAGLKPGERKEVLLDFAALLEEHAFELALLDCLEAGKPIAETATLDIPDTIACIRWHAELTDKLYERVAPTGPENLALIVREPLGVVGLITPWNFPAQMAAWKIAPALAAGNSVVLKPAELTSMSALLMAELAHQAGVPAGVFNAVPGYGPTAGRALGLHMDVDMVAFTGSTEVGREVLRYAADSNLKRVILELGGKSPQVVLSDAPDLDAVAENAVSAAFWNMGENCSCGSRLIIHRSVKDEVLAKIKAVAATWTMGDPLDPTTKLGPMVEPDHLRKVLGYIEAGKAQGARVVLGGGCTLEETGGNYVAVTIFDEATNQMSIAADEIFGPVLTVIPVESDEEAVAIANDTRYGLAASLYTGNVSRAHRYARRLRAGTVSVNCFSEGDISTPFGGFKESGFFGRDKSMWAQQQYTELKTIWMQLD